MLHCWEVGSSGRNNSASISGGLTLYKHAITALALTASGLLLAAGPAAAADEFDSGFTSSPSSAIGARNDKAEGHFFATDYWHGVQAGTFDLSRSSLTGVRTVPTTVSLANAACPAKVSVACLDSVTTVRPSATSSTSCSAAVTTVRPIATTGSPCAAAVSSVRPVEVTTVRPAATNGSPCAAAVATVRPAATSSTACPAAVTTVQQTPVQPAPVQHAPVRPAAVSSACPAVVTMACPASTTTVRPANVSTTWAANMTTTVRPAIVGTAWTANAITVRPSIVGTAWASVSTAVRPTVAIAMNTGRAEDCKPALSSSQSQSQSYAWNGIRTAGWSGWMASTERDSARGSEHAWAIVTR